MPTCAETRAAFIVRRWADRVMTVGHPWTDRCPSLDPGTRSRVPGSIPRRVDVTAHKRRSVVADQPVLHGIPGQGLRPAQAKLRREIRHVASNRVGADAQLAPHVSGGRTGRDMAEDLALPGAQRTGRVHPADRVIDDRSCDAAVEIPLAAPDGADGLDKVGRAGALHLAASLGGGGDHGVATGSALAEDLLPGIADAPGEIVLSSESGLGEALRRAVAARTEPVSIEEPA